MEYKAFIKAALIRAARTVAQTALATILCYSSESAAISSVDWVMVLSASALAGILSVLTSIATGLPEVEL